MKKAIAYIRVSTQEQGADDRYGVEAQKKEIMKYAEANGYEIVDVLVDKISGVKENRPQWDRIILDEKVANPPYEAVIVFKSDRVARDIKLYFYFLYKLEMKGVKLVSTQENFEEGDALANVYRSLMIFVAEQERANIALRTSKGRAIKATRGGYAGGRPPLGYKVVDNELVIDEDEAEIVKTIFAMKADNCSFCFIANALNKQGIKTKTGKEWTMAHIYYICKNHKFYEGYYKYGNKEWVKGVHQPILTVDNE